MGDPTTHPADEVPGGLWDGAPVRVTWEGWSAGPAREWDETAEVGTWHDGGVTVSLDSGTEWLDLRTSGAQTTVNLRLDDPLGLGLAGLAARVYRRLAPAAKDGPRTLNDAVGRAMLSSLPRLWEPHQAHLCTALTRMTRIASYLALSDRLCALVGLELEPGEVAGWEMGETLDPEDPICWELMTRTGRWEAPVAACTTRLPIPALRAAVRVMEATP